MSNYKPLKELSTKEKGQILKQITDGRFKTTRKTKLTRNEQINKAFNKTFNQKNYADHMTILENNQSLGKNFKIDNTVYKSYKFSPSGQLSIEVMKSGRTIKLKQKIVRDKLNSNFYNKHFNRSADLNYVIGKLNHGYATLFDPDGYHYDFNSVLSASSAYHGDGRSKSSPPITNETEFEATFGEILNSLEKAKKVITAQEAKEIRRLFQPLIKASAMQQQINSLKHLGQWKEADKLTMELIDFARHTGKWLRYSYNKPLRGYLSNKTKILMRVLGLPRK
ncbi:hypothetical protein OF377_01385 [Ureaplasma sp. ES3154-GEN]|uniref:hypothetical protein n=1 Tax=Ureaplasma sp. ES3154-GEN TaxID=2984844 RepID=UPI0021E971C0|nr:hypothetical protein [Ureaplasma sp. ES3154-GEN]MCV3743540.1 hypothetical protein [Ureaplasma sp. ES3154-GEN]